MKIILFLLGAALAMAQPVVRAPNDTTVAGLGSAASNRFRVYTVTDGANDSDCTVGGGSTRVICYSSGVTWLNLSGGTGGGAVVAGTGINVAGSTVSIDGAVTATRDIAASGIDNGCLPSGASGTAYTCNPTSLTGPGSVPGKALVAYTQLMPLTFRPDVNCSGSPSTVNVSAQGAKKLFGPDGTTALACTAGQTYSLFYNTALDAAAGAFQQQSGAGGGGLTVASVSANLLPFAHCSAGNVATILWTLGTVSNIACYGNQYPTVDLDVDGTGVWSSFRVPDRWDGSAAKVRLSIYEQYGSSTNTGTFAAEVACPTAVGTTTYNTATSVVVTFTGTAGQLVETAFNDVSMSGCTAGQIAWLRFRLTARTTGTSFLEITRPEIYFNVN